MKSKNKANVIFRVSKFWSKFTAQLPQTDDRRLYNTRVKLYTDVNYFDKSIYYKYKSFFTKASNTYDKIEDIKLNFSTRRAQKVRHHCHYR